MCNSILYTYYHLKIIVLCLEKTCMSFLLYWFLSEKECIYLHVYMYVYQLKQFLKWLYIDIRINSEIWFTKGNGTPLQYCCLENPMDGGAWWAAVHRVAESDTTEWLHFHFPLSCIGEGNGNPLQCSCLENLMDREAW